MRFVSQPIEDLTGRQYSMRLIAVDAQLHERHESPVGAQPLIVGVNAEPTVIVLSRQQGSDPGSTSYSASRRPDFVRLLAALQEVYQREIPDRRVL